MMRIIEENTWPETSFQSLYIKSAPEGSCTKRYVGFVLKGCFFFLFFSLKEISKFSESEKKEWSDAENVYQFFCGGYIHFNISDAILLGGTQLGSYKGKMQFGDKLNLGDKDGEWLTWDKQMYDLYITKPRQRERDLLEREKTSQ